MSETFTDAGEYGRTPDTTGTASAHSASVTSVVNEVSYYDMSGDKYLTIFNHYCYKSTKYFQLVLVPPHTKRMMQVHHHQCNHAFRQRDQEREKVGTQQKSTQNYEDAVKLVLPVVVAESGIAGLANSRLILPTYDYPIYNITNSYKKPPPRNGTNEDVKRLTKLFKDMDYKVTCHENMDHSEIIDKIIEISKQDHKATSCLCFVFLTHGLKGGDLFAADRPYQFRDVTTLLENGHSSLVGKPKIFFVQACRGDQIDSGRRMAIDGSDASIIIPTHADFLVLYSSVENFVSYRNKDGSFLVQELCNVIEEYHKVWDILHIITLVHRRVAYYRTSNAPEIPSIHEKKQMPETRYSLTKLFKF